MTALHPSDAELRDLVRRRDAQEVGQFEVRFTQPEPWIDSLNADYALDAIADKIVWLAVTGGAATLEDVYGNGIPGADRQPTLYDRRYVSASYVSTRGQLTVLSAYCGLAWTKGVPAGKHRERTEACSQQIQHTLRKVQVALSGKRDLKVRSGGALHLHELEMAWQAHPEERIEVPPEPVCAMCNEVIYYANNAWRARRDGQAEALDELTCDRCGGSGKTGTGRAERMCSFCLGRKVRKVTNHVHAPVEVPDA